MNETDEGFQIVPQTKVGALLDRFPNLEGTLMDLAPRFKQLRNPILRRTIAKVATLSQVAAIGKVSLKDMINTLRRAVGIEDRFADEGEEDALSAESPAWFSQDGIARSLDARPLLEAGEHPVQRVLQECKELSRGEIYELITPFLPAPLIEAARKQQFLVWAREEGEGVYKTYFTIPT